MNKTVFPLDCPPLSNGSVEAKSATARRAYAAALLDCQAAAAYLGISSSFLAKRRLFGDGPLYAKFGRRVLYAQQDLEDWRSANTRRSTSASRGP